MDEDTKTQADDCGCGQNHDHKLPEEKVEDLEEAMRKIGFKVEETKGGEIKVTQ